MRRAVITRMALGAAALAAVGAAASQAQDAPGGISAVQVSTEGKQVYEEICQSCHMADAKGGDGAGAAIPALAGNPKLENKDYAITILLKGQGGMPWMTDILTRQQMAAVLTYVRGNFNAYADPVTVADIDRVATDPPPTAVACLCDSN